MALNSPSLIYFCLSDPNKMVCFWGGPSSPMKSVVPPMCAPYVLAIARVRYVCLDSTTTLRTSCAWAHMPTLAPGTTSQGRQFTLTNRASLGVESFVGGWHQVSNLYLIYFIGL